MNQMNQNQPEKTLGEQDELCRKAGFPTITEQKQYWQHKEKEADRLLKAAEAFGVFLGDMNDAIGKLRKVFDSLANECSNLQR